MATPTSVKQAFSKSTCVSAPSNGRSASSRSSVIEHMVSTALFVVFLIEFLLAGAAASSVFFLLMIMALVDVVAGFTISITGAGRDVTMGG